MQLDAYHTQILRQVERNEQGVSFSKFNGLTPRTLSKKLIDLQEAGYLFRDPRTRNYKTTEATERGLFFGELQRFLREESSEKVHKGELGYYLLKAQLESEFLDQLFDDKDLLNSISKLRFNLYWKLKLHLSRKVIPLKAIREKDLPRLSAKIDDLMSRKALLIIPISGFDNYDIQLLREKLDRAETDKEVREAYARLFDEIEMKKEKYFRRFREDLELKD